MKHTLITLSLLLGSFALQAQEFEVPQNYKLTKAEHYAPYEKDVLRCIDWILNTPLDEQEDKRKDANRFLMTWLMGSPYMHLSINDKTMKLFGDHPDLLMAFLAGWTKHSLSTKDLKNETAGKLAGVKTALNFYQKNKSKMPKNKQLEKAIKRQEKGQLKTWIEEHI